MHNNKPVPGKDYWPDIDAWPEEQIRKKHLIEQALIFIVCFSILQFGWQLIRDDDFGHFVRSDLIVKPAAQIIHFISPQIDVLTSGNQIISSGGSLVVKIGCEGLEAVFLMVAGFIASLLSVRSKFWGMLFGSLLIYFLNQIRIVSLFYAFRVDRPFFYLLHGTIAPLALIIFSAAFFQLWLLKHSQD